MKSLNLFRFAIVIAMSAWTVPLGADDQVDLSLQPYIAYVARAGEHTRCGPSEKYYKTDPLKAGQAVEVYLETEDDWLGIRPPDNSFCWLQSDQVQVGEDEVTGTIVDAAAYSWIGTHLGRAQKYSWQVRLDMGEQVTIIGTARRDGPDGEEFWYRIVPPPGEFRWLHRSQIVMAPDEVEHSKPTPLPNRQLANDSKRRPLPEPDDQPQTAVRENPPKKDTNASLDELPIGSGLASSTRPTPPASSQQTAVDGVTPANYAISQTADDQTVGGQAGPVLRSVMPQDQAYRPHADLAAANVEALQLELSRAMAASATSLEVQPLRDRCAQLASNAPDAVNRGRAALLLQRIDDYQKVVNQRNGSNGVQQVAAITEQSVNDPSGIAATTGVETKFDRQGWLIKVYSARPNTPPYAITDSAGRTLSYVTPVPGINLRRYLNQEVGLYGRVAFDTSLETPHIIAEQAVRIRR